MTRTPFIVVAYASWWALLLVWLPAYFMQSRARRGAMPYPAWQTAATVLLIACFALLFAQRPFGLRPGMAPPAATLGALGDALCIAGIAFAIWARLTLGRNWSGLVMTVREGQALVQSGPYALVRHPIYTGLLAGIIGTALVLGTWTSWLAVAAGLVALLIRVEIEDRLMAAEFGDAHAAYRARTRKLIPLLW